MKNLFSGLIIMVLIFTACNSQNSSSSENPEAETNENPATAAPEMALPNRILEEAIPEDPPSGSRTTIIASDLDKPVAFVAADDGRLFFTEKETGNVRIIQNGTLLTDPVLTIPVGAHAEQGLLGITLDPQFAENHYIWVYHTLPARENDGIKVNRVLRFTEQDNVGIEVTPVYTSTNSEGDGFHNAGNLAFGQDSKLYVSLGEDAQPPLAQNLNDPRGSILRFNPTVPLTAPDDNPFFDGDGPHADEIWAHGFRNPFDFVIDPLSDDGRIFSTENGPSCEDEVNLVLPGHNYGWHMESDCDNENRNHPELNSIPPLLYWTPTNAPTGITVYTGTEFPEWHGDIFFCTYLDAKLHRLQLNQRRDGVTKHTTVNGLNCQTDVFMGPNGEFYFVEGGGASPGTLKQLVAADG